MKNSALLIAIGGRIKRILPPLYYAYILGVLVTRGFLRKSGWLKSAFSGMPQNVQGEPLPWYTFSSINFLEQRVRPEFIVFEYGCGQSTFWWTRRVAKVVAVEHERTWYKEMKDRLPGNADLHLAELDGTGSYSNAPAAHPQKFDVVVIDGRDRVRCAEIAVDCLNPDGVIIWDNSNRPRYAPGLRFLEDRGFKRIDFAGVGPVGVKIWCTSILYRRANCLQI